MQKISEEASLQDAIFRKQRRIENLFGRSGIAPLHAHCRLKIIAFSTPVRKMR
ncbi:hypothetical protein [Candidatus Arsenophonus triatominarum]|uniref:hypothetical protein n=1 Tax=Candidatus Arsenophonus triatominarum TaxID=57911 RepID=UPI0016504017|nr:hypothetical protein [Candidatus Arsenophonus triatominarum]